MHQKVQTVLCRSDNMDKFHRMVHHPNTARLKTAGGIEGNGGNVNSGNSGGGGGGFFTDGMNASPGGGGGMAFVHGGSGGSKC